MYMKINSTTARAILAFVLIFGAGSYLLGWSPLLSVRSVEITGAPTKESALAISRSLDIADGEKLARVDPRALSNRLRSFDWIESSQVSRNWISGKVLIAIKTREPIALYNEPGKPQVVLDSSGNTFATPADIADGLPKVSAKSVDGGLAAIKVFTALPESFSKNIDRMSAARANNFLIYGKFEGQDLRIIWGDGEDTDLKVQVIEALLKRDENKNLRMIDVSAPHAPIVK
jgi:cell division septal protein FtsQ